MCRPYTLEELVTLDTRVGELRELPSSIRHELLPGLRQAKIGRKRFAARIAKRHPRLGELLREDGMAGGAWKREKEKLSTDLWDAALLLEESSRIEKETAR